jgi:hypothetical protein
MFRELALSTIAYSCHTRRNLFPLVLRTCEARGSVFGLDTMLQAGSSRVWVSMRWIFFNLLNPSSRFMVLGSIEPLTWVSGIFLAGKEWPESKDTLTLVLASPRQASPSLSDPFTLRQVSPRRKIFSEEATTPRRWDEDCFSVNATVNKPLSVMKGNINGGEACFNVSVP